MRQTLHTLKRLDSAGMLYEMDVTFDYYSDSMRKIASEENYIGHEHGYIDGIWNKESEEDWLTEIQLPIGYTNSDDNSSDKNSPE